MQAENTWKLCCLQGDDCFDLSAWEAMWKRNLQNSLLQGDKGKYGLDWYAMWGCIAICCIDKTGKW